MKRFRSRGEVLEQQVGTARHEILPRREASLDRDSQRSAGPRACHVRRRVPDDHDALERQTRRARARARDGDERVPVDGVIAVGAHGEALAEPDAPQLGARPGAPVAGNEAHCRVAGAHRREAVEQRMHTGTGLDAPHDVDARGERREVRGLHGVRRGCVVLPRVSETRGNTADDGAVRAAGNGHATGGLRPSEHMRERVVESLAARTSGAEQRAIDVEEEKDGRYHGCVRLYHPDYHVTWRERIAELLLVRSVRRVPAGVDGTLVERGAIHAVSGFAEGVSGVHLLGAALLRVDSSWEAPSAPDARATACGAMLLRLRFQQIDRAGQRIPLQPRWYQLDESMHGSRLLMALAEPLDPALRGALAINLASTDVATWEELSAG